ncbi:cysteine hydrolase family protein [Acinetobacter baumannii]|uniref:cysteine hydrolase family protein n=1 Tax=Acinetobacter calcoaceticus/baumannii complex TaxID=909768 RepID=UPI00044DE2DA|nr:MULTISPECIES: cysteine hydrolase family protein [Acinetobacter calcoaceticus/baumannii complex]EXC28621.1 isochorismatase family protein [Acinetobacter sp. 809848]MBN6522178.1 cysteine hydrolase [Acinetobacter pittii]MBN6538759.1 cysteine hydrolase [Acinetobacter pittii]MCH2051850.1 cysteine hydrolase [Acinetobacter pittii]MDE3321047.1 cysteine hydrolase family protein [Acinetobacter nosocomialis]
MSHALVIVDLQNEYLATGQLPLVNINQAVENAKKILVDAREKNTFIIHVRHEALEAESPFFAPNTDGVKIIEEVAPLDNEIIITKNYPNSFLKTELLDTLKKNGIEEITIIGAMSHICIDATTRAASDFGFKCTVIEDACGRMHLEFGETKVSAQQVHSAFMAALGFAYAEIKTTAEYLS